MLVYGNAFETTQTYEFLQTTAVSIFVKWIVNTGLGLGAIDCGGLPMVYKSFP